MPAHLLSSAPSAQEIAQAAAREGITVIDELSIDVVELLSTLDEDFQTRAAWWRKHAEPEDIVQHAQLIAKHYRVAKNDTKTFHRFLELPAEIRDFIYHYAFEQHTAIGIPFWKKHAYNHDSPELKYPPALRYLLEDEATTTRWPRMHRDIFRFPAMLHVNKQVRREAEAIFFAGRPVVLRLECRVIQRGRPGSMWPDDKIDGVNLSVLARQFLNSLTEEQWSHLTRLRFCGLGNWDAERKNADMFSVEIDLAKHGDAACVVSGMFSRPEAEVQALQSLVEEIADRENDGLGKLEKEDFNEIVCLLDWNKDDKNDIIVRNLI